MALFSKKESKAVGERPQFEVYPERRQLEAGG